MATEKVRPLHPPELPAAPKPAPGPTAAQVTFLNELNARSDPLPEFQRRLAELEQQVADLTRKRAAELAAMPRPQAPQPEPPPKIYQVAIVGPDGAVRELRRSASRDNLTPPVGMNALEVDDATWAAMQRGLSGVGAPGGPPGRAFNHYFLNGKWHAQKPLELGAGPGPFVHPTKITVSWVSGLGPIKLRVRGTQEVTATDRLELDARTAGEILVEVTDARYAYSRLLVDVS